MNFVTPKIAASWAAFAAANPPKVGIARVDSTVVVYWPGPDAGWRQQATTDLLPAGTVWTDLPAPYATSGPNFIFIDANPVGKRFFRLYKP